MTVEINPQKSALNVKKFKIYKSYPCVYNTWWQTFDFYVSTQQTLLSLLQCEFCGKVFSDFGSHKRHLRLHTGFKPFTCEHCGRDFTRLDSYKNHIRLHTGRKEKSSCKVHQLNEKFRKMFCYFQLYNITSLQVTRRLPYVLKNKGGFHC